MKDMSVIMAELNAVREEKGLSYDALEKMTGIGHASIHRYLTGKTKKVPMDEFIIICKALKCDIGQAMGLNPRKPVSEKHAELLSIAESVPSEDVDLASSILLTVLAKGRK